MATFTVREPDRGRTEATADPLRFFSTCPQSSQHSSDYRKRLIETARWSENAGCVGSLVYTDNSLVDPWLVSQILIQNTESLCPLVAIQPAYMHPYAVAKMISSIALLSGRRVFLNMVAGGFKNDLAALCDTTPHDRRYQRLVEYTTIIQRLLEGATPVTFNGEFYRVANLILQPTLPQELRGDVLMSGSSEAGIAAAHETGAIPVKYPEPPDRSSPVEAGPCGVRIGIVARRDEDEAWRIAEVRFPEDRKGKITRQLATKVTDSAWHKRLSEITAARNQERETYWLHPFENYHTNCPYLVGSYEKVERQLNRYVRSGYHTFILDIPAEEEEFEHIAHVFEAVSQQSGCPLWRRTSTQS